MNHCPIRTRLRVAATIALLPVLVLTACGSGSGDTDGTAERLKTRINPPSTQESTQKS
ncbi:hypothetical protein ACFY12_08780 [Streptomyces sp. NPDC001339]|uniref:hypothetical protein n=1 Tax=Streptomyces sp. NPDC001339 TaxID=3364563 RepID=UPI0036CFD4F1